MSLLVHAECRGLPPTFLPSPHAHSRPEYPNRPYDSLNKILRTFELLWVDEEARKFIHFPDGWTQYGQPVTGMNGVREAIQERIKEQSVSYKILDFKVGCIVAPD